MKGKSKSAVYFQKNPDARKKMSEIKREYYAEKPEARRKTGEERKKYFASPETRKKHSEVKKKFFEKNPEALKKMSDVTKKYFEDPEARKKNSERMKKHFKENPEAGRKHSERMKKFFEENPEAGRKHSERMKKHFEDDPEARKKLSDIHKKIYEDLQWYGSVKYYDGSQYCEKWTPELRERVRAYFGYVCVECGTPQTDKKLAVHHVHYNKKLCCDDTPRTLVSLCRSCHAKTTKGDRDDWSNHFQEIIDTYYGGRCWFTKEEMRQYCLH